MGRVSTSTSTPASRFCESAGRASSVAKDWNCALRSSTGLSQETMAMSVAALKKTPPAMQNDVTVDEWQSSVKT